MRAPIALGRIGMAIEEAIWAPLNVKIPPPPHEIRISPGDTEFEPWVADPGAPT